MKKNSPRKPERQLPLLKALSWIAISVACVFGATLSIFFIYNYIQHVRSHDDKYSIVALIQTGPEKEALSTHYLASWLGLSGEHKVNLVSFDEKLARKALLSSPVIKSAHIKKIFPDTLYVDYTIRSPICSVYDYENVVMDADGYVFPLLPYFTPKKLPEIYLGLLPFGSGEDDFGRKGACWNTPLNTKEACLALNVVKELTSSECSHYFRLLRVDTSSAYSDLYGQRQIVLVLEDVIHKQQDKKIVTYTFPRILRVSTDHYLDELQKYLVLREKLTEDALKVMNCSASTCHVRGPATIIDLRLPQLAYIRY